MAPLAERLRPRPVRCRALKRPRRPPRQRRTTLMNRRFVPLTPLAVFALLASIPAATRPAGLLLRTRSPAHRSGCCRRTRPAATTSFTWACPPATRKEPESPVPRGVRDRRLLGLRQADDHPRQPRLRPGGARVHHRRDRIRRRESRLRPAAPLGAVPGAVRRRRTRLGTRGRVPADHRDSGDSLRREGVPGRPVPSGPRRRFARWALHALRDVHEARRCSRRTSPSRPRWWWATTGCSATRTPSRSRAGR